MNFDRLRVYGLVAVWTVCLLAASSLAMAMPNPMVSYGNFHEVSMAMGFEPLFLPKISGYESTAFFVIDKTTADLRYQSWNPKNQDSEFIIRSARKTADGLTDISGIYSVKWKKEQIDHTWVEIAQTGENSYAARWSEGDFLFSAAVKNLDRSHFMGELAYCLVDLTEHYYQK